MNTLLVMYFVLFTLTLAGCGKDGDTDCTENQVWNEESKKCEGKPVETALLTQEQCKNENTKIWDTETNKCKDRTQNECNNENTKWENDKCVKGEEPEDTKQPTKTESEELYTITNNSAVTVGVSVFNDPSILSEIERSDYHKHDEDNNWRHGDLQTGACLSITKSRFVNSLQLKRNSSIVHCNNFSLSGVVNTCGDLHQPSHLIINDHPTKHGKRYGWIYIETSIEKNTGDCPALPTEE